MPGPVLALVTAVAALVAAMQAAHAEGIACGDHAGIVAQLEGTYQESRHGIGIASNNAVLEVYASETSGTFSVLVTLPSGQTCLIASGRDYQSLATPLQAQGKGA